MEDVTNIVRDTYLLDFYERKYNTTLMIGCQEVTSLSNYYNGKTFQHKETEKIPYELTEISLRIEDILKNDYLPIYEILILCEGKLCLYGNTLVNILSKPPGGTFRIDLCFHSCSEKQAKIYLLQCFDKLQGNVYYNGNIVVSIDDYSVEFFSVIYKDRGELLRNIGNTPVRHGYDPIAKYFSTVTTAISTVTRMCPLDIILNYKDILICDCSGIKFVFHGNNKNLIPLHDCFVFIYDCKGSIIFHLNNIQQSNNDISVSRKDLREKGNIKFTLYKDIGYQKYNPRTRFGKDYVPIIIGISNSRYVAFSNCRRQYNLNDDIFHLLCRYWYLQEVFDAKSRLLK